MAARALVRIGGWTAVVTAALLAGCAPKQAPPPPVPPTPPVEVRPLSPAAYILFAGSAANFAARASTMAEARGSTSKIKSFASRVVMDQTGIGAQLSFAGRRIDLLPEARPIAQHQAMLEELANSGANFDATYKRLLGKVLSDAIVAHQAFEARGESPTLRPVAAFAGPVCAKNLEQLRKL